MRILIVTQYFWPESFVINDMAQALQAQGHDVTVATGKPNYPHGTVWPGYTRGGTQRETYAGGIRVVRAPLRPRGKASRLSLALNYLSFIVSGVVYFPCLLRGEKFDSVLFFGPSPMTSAIPAILLSRLKHAHLSLWIQDLWPQSLKATGLVRNRFLLSLVSSVVGAIYRASDILLLQSEGFKEPIRRYADDKKMIYFPNPAPLETDAAPPLPAQLDAMFDNCFPVVFAGNLGRAQSLDTIVEAAEQLKEEKNIRFFLIGTGSEAESIHHKVLDRSLENVTMVGPLERCLMPAVFRRAGALLVTLKNEDAFNMVVPSKIQAYMQAGRPIIGALNGESARLIEDSGCGSTVPAEDSRALAKSILTLAATPVNRLAEMGSAGRHFFEVYFEAGNAARRLVKIIERRQER